MKSSIARLQAKLYPHRHDRDAVAVFLNILYAHLRPGLTVLDVGAGAGTLNTYSIRGRVNCLYGVDVDPRVMDNPLVDCGLVSDGKSLPLRAESIDLAFSIYVQEHIGEPAEFAAELFRVLRPGGVYLALTPNRFHYVPALAAITPTPFHRWLNEKRGREASDTFPTLYRFNTPGSIDRHFRAAGFGEPEVKAIEVEPQYLKFHPVPYLLGAAYERVVNAIEFLSALRVNLIVICRKPEPSHCSQVVV